MDASGAGWQPTVSRVLLNDALATLTERWNAAAALLVIREFDSLPGLTTKQTRRVTQESPENAKVRIGAFNVMKIVWEKKGFAGITFAPLQQEYESASYKNQSRPSFQLAYYSDSKKPYKLYRLEWVPAPPSFQMYLRALTRFFKEFRILKLHNWKTKHVTMYAVADDEFP